MACLKTTPSMPSTAIVLSGGLGTRLRSAVPDRPKVLASVAGKPFLGYVLTYLAQQGIRRVILSTGYLAEQVRAYAESGTSWGLEIQYVEEQIPLGTGGALRQASLGLNSAFFALNGDTLFLADLQALWQAHRSIEAVATVALAQVRDSQQRGSVTLAPNGKILSFVEKPASPLDEPVSAVRLANAGVYVLEPHALASLRPGEPASIERQVFPQLAEQGLLVGNIQEAYFVDIGTPQSLAAFERDILAGCLPGYYQKIG